MIVAAVKPSIGGADSDTESRASTARSDPAGSDSEDEEKSSKPDSTGIPRIPELEPEDITVSSVHELHQTCVQIHV